MYGWGMPRYLVFVCLLGLVRVKDARHDVRPLHNDLLGDDDVGSSRPFSASGPELKCGWQGLNATGYDPCGDGYCFCKDTFARCENLHSQNFGVPRLPDAILHLDLSGSHLQYIDDFFFLNVTNITSLNLASNGLRSLNETVFRPLKRLTSLWLFGNLFRSYERISLALSLTTLKLLDVSGLNFVWSSDDVFSMHPLLRLETLCMGFNDITKLNMSIFKPLINLKHLNLSYAKLDESSLVPAFLPQLRGLYLSRNYFGQLPVTCREGESLFPNLQVLNMTTNMFYTILNSSQPVCLPRLQVLSLWSSNFHAIKTDSFNTDRFPSLRKLYLGCFEFCDNNVNYFTVEAFAFNSSLLQEINLRNAMINFRRCIDVNAFAGCPNLRRIELASNFLYYIGDEAFNRVLSQVPRLSSLSLSSSSLTEISPTMFANMSSLTTLLLDSNYIERVPDGTFNTLPNLEVLDLSGNKLTAARDTVFSSSMLQRLKHLSLSNNSLWCTCELGWLKRQLLTHPAVFNDSYFGHPWNRYPCDNIPGETVQSFPVIEQPCLLNHNASIAIIVLTTLFICFTIFASFRFSSKWGPRLKVHDGQPVTLYETYMNWEQLQQHHFQYDVFVSYASDDQHWVVEHLIPELEGRLGLRLCIPARDLEISAESIANSIGSSRRALLVFSAHYAHNRRCHMELELCCANVRSISRGAQDGTILVVMLQEISSRDMPSAMTSALERYSVCGWSDRPEARQWFWTQMQQLLNARQ